MRRVRAALAMVVFYSAVDFLRIVSLRLGSVEASHWQELFARRCLRELALVALALTVRAVGATATVFAVSLPPAVRADVPAPTFSGSALSRHPAVQADATAATVFTPALPLAVAACRCQSRRTLCIASWAFRARRQVTVGSSCIL